MILFAVLTAVVLASDPDARPDAPSPAQAFVSGSLDLCPLFLRRGGISALEEARIERAAVTRAGPVAELRQADPAYRVMLIGEPDGCVVIVSSDDDDLSRHSPLINTAHAMLLARLNSGDSGWVPVVPAPSDDPTFRNDVGQTLRVSRDAGGAGAWLSSGRASPPTATDYRRAAQARPPHEVMLWALETVCRLPPGRFDTDAVTLRHAGVGEITVRLRNDCQIIFDGDAAAEVQRAVEQILAVGEAGWRPVRLAYLPLWVDERSGNDRPRSTWIAQDGHLLAVQQGGGSVALTVWSETEDQATP